MPALAVLGTDGAAAVGDARVAGGQTLGDFRLLEEVGRGGMGVVYEAEQISLGRRIAVKVLPFAGMFDSQQLARFKNEARAAATLNHPNIVGIYFVGCDRGVHYYAMQYVDGLSLDRVIAGMQADAGKRPNATDSSLPEGCATEEGASLRDTHRCSLISTQRASNRAEFYRSVAQLGVQAAEALHHAHELSIVHRDVKPGNLLLEPSGKLWVTDFGLARIEGQGNLTLTGDLLGTLRYMSPEQALGNRVVVDHRTDIYSLGATLYELVALKPVVSGHDRASIMRGLAADPVPLHTHDRRVPPDLETILLKALQREPSDRYATANELADDLRRFLGRQSILARRPTITRRLANRVRRYPQLSLVIGLACIVVTLTGSLAAWSIDSARRETAFQRAAVENREQLQREAEAQVREHVYVKIMQRAGHAWQDDNLGPVYWALDELKPRPGEPDLRGFEWHYLSNLRRNTPLPFGKHQGSAYAASFSPDEMLLATAGGDGVRIWAWPSRTELKHLREATEDVDGIAWSPDGERLVSFSEDWHVRVYRTKDWSVETSFRLPGPLVQGRFTPDGRTLLIAERKQSVSDSATEGHNVVHIYDVGAWKSRGTLTGLTQITQAMAVSSDGRFVAAVADDAVCVWDSSTLRLLHRWPQKDAHAIAFAHRSPQLAVGLQGEIRFYDVASGKLLSTLSGFDGQEGIAFGADDRLLVSVGRAGVARVWRQSLHNVWNEAYTFVHAQPLWGVSVDQDGLVVTTAHDGGVLVWDSKRGQDRRRIIASPKYVRRWLDATAAGAKPDDEFAVMAERWSHLDPPPKDGIATAIAWSPDGREAVVSNTHGDLTLWDAELREPRGQLVTAIPLAGNLAWSSDGRWIALSGVNALAIIERESLRLVNRANISSFNTPLLTFSKDGKTVFTAWRYAAARKSVEAFRVPSLEAAPSLVPADWRRPADTCAATGDDLSILLEGPREGLFAEAASEIHAGKVANSTFSQDHQTIALIKGGGRIDVLRASAWQPRVQIVTGVHGKDPLVLSPNGRTLAILMRTGQVTLWSTVTGQQYFSFNPQLNAPAIRFSPDGTKLVALGNGNFGAEEIVVWDATPAHSSDIAPQVAADRADGVLVD